MADTNDRPREDLAVNLHIFKTALGEQWANLFVVSFD